MSTDTALIEKRDELKRRLVAGEYKTLVDLVLAGTDSLFRKVSRRSKPFPLWLLTIFLGIVYTLINFSGVYVLGEWSVYLNFNEAYFGYGSSDLQIILLNVFSSVFGIATIVVINHYIGRIFTLWQTRVLDATESISSLDEFQYWLDIVCHRRLQFLLSIVGGLIFGLYGAAIISTRLGVSVDYGLVFAIISACALGSPFLYLLLTVVLLVARLRRYDLKLFAADPSSSEVVSHLSGELSFFGYFVAAYAAILTLWTALNSTLASVGIILVVLYWLPIIALFILSQTGLSRIVQRAKWKTLNEAQAKIEKLRASKSFGNPQTMDAINKLMDYHDRVKATRDSALDFRTYLSFINSLLLPLLAFILGNLDLMLNLFARKP